MPNIVNVLWMKIARAGILLLLLFAGTVRAENESGTETGEVFVLVRLTDFAGVTTYTSATPAEVKEMASEAKMDNQALPTAYANLRKEWRKTKGTVEKRTVNIGGKKQQVSVPVPPPSFPLKKCPEPRVVKQMGKFPTAEALDKAKGPLEESEAKQVSRLAREKEDKEALLASRADPLVNVIQDTSGLKRPPPKPPTKKNTPTKPVSPVSEEEMLSKLIGEIERINIENEAAGTGGLRGVGDLKSMNAQAGIGDKKGSKAGPVKIKRMGE